MVNLEEYIYLNYDESDDDDVVSSVRPSDPFALSERQFKRNYRLSKPLARSLIAELRPLMVEGRRTSDLTVSSKIMMSLNFFATGSYQNAVANHINAAVSQSSVSQSVSEVVAALNNPVIFNRWIRFPSNYQELETNSRRFYDLYGLPGVVGCIDCTHVAIHAPPDNGVYDERSYVNRKGYHSINTQLICDADLKIINVNALFPGATHDSFIWNQSAVQPLMRSIHSSGNGRYYLIGDSGYGLRPWLHTPIPEPRNGREEQYNRTLKTARATIERCNGVLKGRFRCLLKHRVLHYAPEKAVKIINSCCVLHNMCIGANLDIDDEDEDANENLDFGVYNVDPVEGRRNRDLIAGELFRNRIVNNYF